MDDQSSLIITLFDKAQDYTKNTVQLYKMKVVDKSADIISNLSARLAVLACFILGFLILNIGLALWIGKIIGEAYYGFFIIAGFYALLGIVVYLFRNQLIKKPVRNSIIMHALN